VDLLKDGTQYFTGQEEILTGPL